MSNRPYSRKTLKALADGNIVKANELIGSAFHLSGVVVHGNHLGRTLGFPTANLALHDKSTVLPAFGVYAIRARINNVNLKGMANVGIRPTINGTSPLVEINFFDFNDDLYGLTVDVYFYFRIREEKKFLNLNDLVNQIIQDKTAVQYLLTRWDEPDANAINTF